MAGRKGKSRETAENFRSLSHEILRCANARGTRNRFLGDVTGLLRSFLECDAVQLRLKLSDDPSRCEHARRKAGEFRFEIRPTDQDGAGRPSFDLMEDAPEDRLCAAVAHELLDPSYPHRTERGLLWIRDAAESLPGVAGAEPVPVGGEHKSIALAPIAVGGERIGVLLLQSRRRGAFAGEEMVLLEGISESLGLALLIQRSRAALQERVKEQSCLYQMARIADEPGASLENILNDIAALLPPAWQYPGITSARIVFDAHAFATSGYKEGGEKLTSPITVEGTHRGLVEVAYAGKNPRLDEGPFLKEERSLIDAVARQVALVIERKEAEQASRMLEEQLRHADRLATIGQLAAGVAHELNEPLGNILGFAQLAKKDPGLSDQAGKDMGKIIRGSLQAREVIRNLLTFARQTPSKKTQFDLNRLVREALSFFEPRCAKEGIKVVRDLSPDLPEITADRGQINQVVVNLVVNALQAMPKGGTLTLRTAPQDGMVSLSIQDTGEGMTEEIRRQVFLPFFTTKGVGKGTGLGLSVSYGIVTAHGGEIRVRSRPGRGTRFDVVLPMKEPEGSQEKSSDGIFEGTGTNPRR
ncbi:MAG: sensor histidine kinase [Planctomycetota bacterium]|jgi:signal transduction histidine kinase